MTPDALAREIAQLQLVVERMDSMIRAIQAKEVGEDSPLVKLLVEEQQALGKRIDRLCNSIDDLVETMKEAVAPKKKSRATA